MAALGTWNWNSADLTSVLGRMTSPQMRCWMQRESSTTEMIALTSTLLYHSVLARCASTVPLSVLETLPTEVLENILFFAAGNCLSTRLNVQSVCRLFRCLLVLNSTFQTDLASLPTQPAAFFAHFYRAHSRKRPFHLILDRTNDGMRLPPPACLISGLAFAQTIIVKHTLTVTDVVGTLARLRSCPLLTELVLAPIGDFRSARRLLPSFREKSNVLSVCAPRLTRLELNQIPLDFPDTYGLRHLKIDCRNDHEMFSVANVLHPKTLHSLLARNTRLEVVDLASAVGVCSLHEGPTSSLMLPLVKEFRLATGTVLPMLWLLPCLVVPADAYMSFKVGENSRESVDLRSLVAVTMPYMQARVFDTLTVVHSFRRTSLLFSHGHREWEDSSGSTSLFFQPGRYSPCSGAVDIDLCYTRPSVDAICWTDVLYAFRDAGFDVSCLKTYEFRGDYELKRLSAHVLSLVSRAHTLRFWPESSHTVKSSLWQLCAPSPVAWSVVVRNFVAIFPGVRAVVDARTGKLWIGRSSDELMAHVRALPYQF